METKIDCYDELELKKPAHLSALSTPYSNWPEATPEKIRNQFLKMAKRYHLKRQQAREKLQVVERSGQPPTIEGQDLAVADDSQATNEIVFEKLTDSLQSGNKREAEEITVAEINSPVAQVVYQQDIATNVTEEDFAKIYHAYKTLIDPRKKYAYDYPNAGYFAIKLPRIVRFVLEHIWWKKDSEKQRKREEEREAQLKEASAQASFLEKPFIFIASFLFGVGAFAFGLAALSVLLAVISLSIIGVWFIPSLIPKSFLQKFSYFVDSDLDAAAGKIAQKSKIKKQKILNRYVKIASSLAFICLTLLSPLIAVTLIIGATVAGYKYAKRAYKELVARGMSDRQKIALAVCLTVILLVAFPPAGAVSAFACAGPVAIALGMANWTLAGFTAGLSSLGAAITGSVVGGILALWRWGKAKMENLTYKKLLNDDQALSSPVGSEFSEPQTPTEHTSTARLLTDMQNAQTTSQSHAEQKIQSTSDQQPQATRPEDFERLPIMHSPSGVQATSGPLAATFEPDSAAVVDEESQPPSRKESQASLADIGVFGGERKYSDTGDSAATNEADEVGSYREEGMLTKLTKLAVQYLPNRLLQSRPR